MSLTELTVCFYNGKQGGTAIYFVPEVKIRLRAFLFYFAVETNGAKGTTRYETGSNCRQDTLQNGQELQLQGKT